MSTAEPPLYTDDDKEFIAQKSAAPKSLRHATSKTLYFRNFAYHKASYAAT